MIILKIHIISSIIIYAICFIIGRSTARRVRERYSDFKSHRKLSDKIKKEIGNVPLYFVPVFNVFVLIIGLWLSTRTTEEVYNMKGIKG